MELPKRILKSIPEKAVAAYVQMIRDYGVEDFRGFIDQGGVPYIWAEHDSRGMSWNLHCVWTSAALDFYMLADWLQKRAFPRLEIE